MQVVIQPAPPYDFATSAAATRFLYTAARQTANGGLRRLARIGERLVLLEFCSAGTVVDPAITVDVLAANGEVDSALLEAKARRLLNARADLTTFYGAHNDTPMQETTTRLRGLHALGADTLFEAIGLTMIEQQITLKMAQTAERWLMSWAGACLSYEGETYYTFPSPKQIANTTVDDIIPMKITGVRIGRLINLAKMIEEGGGVFETLRDSAHEEVYDALRAVSGVGHWTAAWAMIRGIGHYTYFGKADVALRAAVNHYYFGQTGRVDPDVMDTVFARYGKHSGLAAFYILMRWAFERY